jgi:hypothetical protein
MATDKDTTAINSTKEEATMHEQAELATSHNTTSIIATEEEEMVNELVNENNGATGAIIMDDSELASPVRILDAVPRKRMVRDSAAKMSPDDALGELVDNVIDNFDKQQVLGYGELNLHMDIMLADDKITIGENSGGVNPDDLLGFVQLGGESPIKQAHLDEMASIGVWGQGQKQALARLGYDQLIATRYWDSRTPYNVGTAHNPQYTQQLMIRTNRDWWFGEDWSVPIYVTEQPIPSGTTHFVIRSLNTPFTPCLTERVVKELAGVYGDLLHARGGEVEIVINGQRLAAEPHLTEDALKSTFAYVPGLEPVKHIYDVSFERACQDPATGEILHTVRPLRMEVIVGLTPQAEKDKAGVYMFGTPQSPLGRTLGPRMFAEKLQDEAVGYVEPGEGKRGETLMRKNDPLLGRLRIYVNFYGASEDIPWGIPGSPVKKGFNAAHEAAAKIRARILEAAAPFVRVAPKAREIDIIPFSVKWNDRGETQRLDLVRRSAELDPSDLALEQVKDQAKPLVEYQFDPAAAVIHEWDHTTAQEPPVAAASFDEKLAKEFVAKVDARKKQLAPIAKDSPVLAVKELLDTLPLGAEPLAADEDYTAPPAPADLDALQQVNVRLKVRELHELMRHTATTSKADAVAKAVRTFLQTMEVGPPETEPVAV